MSRSSVLYLLNESGEVYSFKDETISKLDSCGALFKKIDAGKTAIWAIGENNLVYIFVHKRDLPLVVTEESFENQRWNPKGGFSSKLLPTDRPQFSSEDGLVDRSLNTINLPSLAWEWESDWAVCSRLGSLPLDYEGWMYALDFPRTYHAEKKWNSYVRRRKWFRRCKFLSFDTWVPVTSPSNFTSGDEFIIDLAVGGSSFKGKEQFFLSVWIVTVQGKVAFRSNITEQSPEGTDWLIVSTPYGANMAQISVGSTGIVWTLTWDGDAFFRTGIDPYRPEGTGWLQIIAPGSPLASISVGLCTVWATTRDTRVWFRKGVRKRRSHSNDADSAGECWCPVDGGMKVISTTPADQVFAIGNEDYQLYFRTGVKEDNLCGDFWIRVNIKQSEQDERTSIASLSIGSRDEWMKESQRDEILNTMNEGVSVSSDIAVDNVKRELTGEPLLANQQKLDDSCPEQQSGFLSGATLGLEPVGSKPSVDIIKKAALSELEVETQLEPNAHLQQEEIFGLESQISCTDSQILSQSDVFYDAIPGSVSLQETIASMSQVDLSENSVPKESVIELVEDYIQQRTKDRDFEARQTVMEDVINEENVSLILAKTVNLPPPIELEKSLEKSFSNRRGSTVTLYSIASTVQLFEYNWISISAGAYHLSTEKLSDWCRDRQQDTRSARSWDVAAVKSTQKISSQENASPKPENRGVKAGSGFWYLEGRWHGCKFDLECWEDKDGVLSIFTKSKRLQVNVHNIVYCTIVYDFGRIHLCLLTRKNLSSPVRFSSGQETENELWLSYITRVCRLSHHLIGNFDTRGIYVVTNRNSLLLSSALQPNEDEARIEDLCTSAISSLPVQWNLKHGFYPGSTISFIGTVPPASTRFYINLTCHPHNLEGNVAFHLNPRFQESEYCVVRNSKIDGVWGDEERDGDFNLDISGGGISIEIECREDCYKVSINNVDAYTFLHRVPFEKVKCLKIGGDVIVCSVKYTSEKPTLKPRERFFHQISGHFKRIENHESGVVWAIGCDGNVWVHTGGYNGPWPCKIGLEESPGRINCMIDFKVFEIYENQRWNLKHGFSNVLLPTDRPHWSDITGLIKLDKVKITLPSTHFSWISDWMVDQDLASGTDSDGWQYAVDFPANYHSHKTILDFVRRRKWIRKCQISVDGPWERQGFSTLIDASLKPGKYYGDEIPVWAVTTTGGLIYRKGVTPSSPLGTEWESVSTEHPVISVSAGLQTEVWCVSKDGSPMIRSGINSSFPMGRYWLYIEKPKDFALSKVSVGLNAVWALDVNFHLYFRREVTSQYPEGTAWELVSENVIDFSVGQNNQVWAILDKKGGKKSGLTLLTRRTLLGDVNPVGVGWETGIVGYWTALCTKGDIV